MTTLTCFQRLDTVKFHDHKKPVSEWSYTGLTLVLSLLATLSSSSLAMGMSRNMLPVQWTYWVSVVKEARLVLWRVVRGKKRRKPKRRATASRNQNDVESDWETPEVSKLR